jgi:addiction module HigA family antidote
VQHREDLREKRPPGNRLEALKGKQAGRRLPLRSDVMLPTHRTPTHPGEILLKEFLEPMKVPQIVAAKKMQISMNRLNEIVHGKRGVTADTAIRLSVFLKTSPDFWLNLQNAYDLYAARVALAV